MCLSGWNGFAQLPQYLSRTHFQLKLILLTVHLHTLPILNPTTYVKCDIKWHSQKRIWHQCILPRPIWLHCHSGHSNLSRYTSTVDSSLDSLHSPSRACSVIWGAVSLMDTNLLMSWSLDVLYDEEMCPTLELASSVVWEQDWWCVVSFVHYYKADCRYWQGQYWHPHMWPTGRGGGGI